MKTCSKELSWRPVPKSCHEDLFQSCVSINQICGPQSSVVYFQQNQFLILLTLAMTKTSSHFSPKVDMFTQWISCCCRRPLLPNSNFWETDFFRTPSSLKTFWLCVSCMPKVRIIQQCVIHYCCHKKKLIKINLVDWWMEIFCQTTNVSSNPLFTPIRHALGG